MIKFQEEKVRSSQNKTQKQQFLKAIQELEIDEGSTEMLPKKYNLIKTTDSEESQDAFDLEELYGKLKKYYLKI